MCDPAQRSCTAECGDDVLPQLAEDIYGATYNTADTGNDYEPGCGSGGGPDVAWLWHPPASGEWSIDTLDSNFDTVLQVYRGCDLQPLACNDDEGVTGTGASFVTVTVTRDEPLLILTDGYGGASGDVFLYVRQAGTLPTGSELGLRCDAEAVCNDICFSPSNGINPFCTFSCASDTDCPDGASCWTSGFCLPNCTTDADCTAINGRLSNPLQCKRVLTSSGQTRSLCLSQSQTEPALSLAPLTDSARHGGAVDVRHAGFYP